LCRPDAICKSGTDKITIKNPIGYPFRILKRKQFKKPFMRGFSCGVCNKEFKTSRALAQHKSRSH
jgi:hypothetical protein